MSAELPGGKAVAPPAPGKAAGKGKGPPGKAPPPPSKGAGKAAGKAAPAEHTGPRLRPLFVTVANKVLPDSVWEEAAAAAPFDVASLERHFVLEAGGSTMAKRGSNDASNKAGSNKRGRVLDDKSAHSLNIQFSRLPPPERLSMMIDRFEDFPEGLSQQAVLALSAAIAAHGDAVEKMRQLNLPDCEVEKLDTAEKYLWVFAAVPFCHVKLSCGALMVGPAREICNLRYDGKVVATCCKSLRESDLLRRCIFTCLSVSNVMNRGTARSDACALVLPDALLKFEELRGAGKDAGDTGITLLDFVAEAVAKDASKGSSSTQSLRSEIDELRKRVKSAMSVSMEETESGCNQIVKEAKRVQTELQTVTPRTDCIEHIAKRVATIAEEADGTLALVIDAKSELAKAIKWCCAKSPKNEDFLGGWSNFLEQLSRAFGRIASNASRPPSADSRAASKPPVQAAAAKSEMLPPRGASRSCFDKAIPAIDPVALASIAANHVVMPMAEETVYFSPRGSTPPKVPTAVLFQSDAQLLRKDTASVRSNSYDDDARITRSGVIKSSSQERLGLSESKTNVENCAGAVKVEQKNSGGAFKGFLNPLADSRRLKENC